MFERASQPINPESQSSPDDFFLRLSELIRNNRLHREKKTGHMSTRSILTKLRGEEVRYTLKDKKRVSESEHRILTLKVKKETTPYDRNTEVSMRDLLGVDLRSKGGYSVVIVLPEAINRSDSKSRIYLNYRLGDEAKDFRSAVLYDGAEINDRQRLAMSNLFFMINQTMHGSVEATTEQR